MLTLFDAINFTNPDDKESYIGPGDIEKIVKKSETKEGLRQLLVRYINVIKNAERITSAPADPQKRKQFWSRLENLGKLIVESLQKKTGAKEKREVAQILLQFAIKVEECATIYKCDLEQVYCILSGPLQNRTLQEQTYDLLKQIPAGAVDLLLSRIDSDAMQPHTREALNTYFTNEFGLQTFELDIYGKDIVERLKRDPVQTDLYRAYISDTITPVAAIEQVVEHTRTDEL